MPEQITGQPCGLLLFDKPRGITSHDAVYILRRKLGIKKIGHGGTLDPLATGLLILLAGKATKQQAALQGGSKIYSGTITFGQETDTWDLEGKTQKTAPLPSFENNALQNAISKLSGEIEQQVPPFSAIKYKGEKLYDIARSGREVPVIMRKVSVKWLECSPISADTVFFRTEVSGGTYIRTLARDLGLAMGSCAYLSSLRRESIGKYDVKDAITEEALKAADKEEIIKRLLPITGISN
ncbi:MAG: tRNA pseudouridine(55) synthase TruB [Elusimicrobiales bacterium]|nr:tRNA pseudouridine(55) synthase TruB [Elusimicrobiales bacterium]